MAQGFTLIRHRRGAPALRLGLGPGLRPVDAVGQLAALFEGESFWARGRSPAGIRRMLRGSDAVVSIWKEGDLVGFGRATSDGIYRAVLWDVVVASAHGGQGLGRRLVETLLATPVVARAERIYLMTTNGRGFYERLDFRTSPQQLMIREGSG
ncbi:MAG: GNAT family N-acetyltransferase [Synechococcaceae cyanobacterium]|nr:GNAT family N-acetyltransferase [Synechococcaceae cyanobacterium]